MAAVMNNQHTPGPWFAHEDAVYASDERTDDSRVCDTYGPVWRAALAEYKESVDTERANARLIAAAPEMLEALEALTGDNNDSLTYAERCAKALQLAHTVIRKARGGQ